MSTIILTFEEKQKQSGNALAAMAVRALTARGFVAEAGMCQRFLRQVVQSVYGNKYDACFAADAEQSRQLWIWHDVSVKPENGSIIGDILYKRATSRSPHGHVGIRIAGNRVAENSTVHHGEFGGRGTRSLSDFGKVDTIVRLPKV